jgi:hypothetical protein
MTEGKRFYAIDDLAASELAMGCRVKWSLPDGAEIGPVNTNYHANSGQPISLVVVCESPSFAEVENDYPAWGDTGLKIFNRWRCSRGLASVEKILFEHYQLAENGIYVTNLVRCQADWIPNDCYAQGARLLTSLKDERVINAWPLNRDFLATELRNIAELHKDASVLFACGTKFKAQIKEATEFAETAGLKWLASFHPSRLAENLSWHYNPQEWGDRQGTFPPDRGEKNRNEPVNADDADSSA